MADKPKTGNPFVDAWISGQQQFFEAQQPMLESVSGMMGGGDISETMRRAQGDWELCQKQASDWMEASRRWLTPGTSAGDEPDGIAEETLRRMLDPTRFLYAGTDEVNQAIQRLVEGPELADIGTLERQVLKATTEWLALREAGAQYRMVTAAAWSRAFESFSKEMLSSPSLMQSGARAVLYVTDRCVFTASPEGLKPIEIAPGIDLERDILAHMDFKPVIESLATMDPRMLRPEPMGLKADMLDAPIESRITLDSEGERLLVNLRGNAARSQQEIDAIREREVTVSRSHGDPGHSRCRTWSESLRATPDSQ